MDTQTASATPENSTSTAQPLKMTEKAVAQVKEVIRAQGFEGYFLSIRVVPAGCSGLGYDLNLVKESKPNDVIWEQDGIKLATDPMSVRYLNGTEVDYVTSLQGAGFKFSNPNAKSSCGCGTSFTT
jgi:iron-sulfur cluster assembly protein